MVSSFALDMRRDWGRYVGERGGKEGVGGGKSNVVKMGWPVFVLGGMFVSRRLFLVVASLLLADLAWTLQGSSGGESFVRACLFAPLLLGRRGGAVGQLARYKYKHQYHGRWAVSCDQPSAAGGFTSTVGRYFDVEAQVPRYS